MDINKIVAQNELKILGGTPRIRRFWDETNKKSIDIYKSINVPQQGIQSCGSIGLNQTDIGLESNNKDLRVEILGASDISVENFENIMATVAFEIMDSGKCYPGNIIENVIPLYIPDCDMKHILLHEPFLWEKAQSIALEDVYIAWLMVVPISDAEYNYAKENGIDSLEEVFEEKQIDVYNIYRESVI